MSELSQYLNDPRIAKVMLFGTLALCAGVFKVAAHLYRRTELSWRDAFIVVIVTILATLLAGALLNWAPGILKTPLSAAVVIAACAWFLQRRARTNTGEKMEMREAVKLSALGYGLLTVTIAIPVMAMVLIFRNSQS